MADGFSFRPTVFTGYDHSPIVNAFDGAATTVVQQRALSDLSQKIKAGDYDGAAQSAFAIGKPEVAIHILGLSQKEKQRQAEATAGAGLSSAIGGLDANVPAAPAVAPPGGPVAPAPASDPMAGYQAAIQRNESGGNYQALGPVTKNGDRAYGAHQVMGANIGPWTKEILGQELTHEQFLASKEAQDAVFKGKFGQYVQQTGNPQDAASMWFTGKPLAEGAGRKDMLGTSGQAYVDKFTAALPQGSQATALAPEGDGPPQDPRIAQIKDQVATRQVQSAGAQGTQALVKALSNPNLPDGARQTGLVILKKRLDASDIPDSVKEYVWARSNGMTEAKSPAAYAREKAAPTILKSGDIVYDPTGNKAKFTAPQGPNQNQKTEEGLRGEFDKHTKDFAAVHDAYGRVIAATQQREANPNGVSPASDIGLVFGFMKILDPGSVVREGEYATAKNAGGVPDVVRNAYNKAINGQFLQPAQRQDFVDTAGRLYAQARTTAEGNAERFKGLAKQYGADPERSVYLPPALQAPKIGERRGEAPAPKQPAAPITEGATATNPQTKERMIYQGGKWVPFT